MLKRLTVPVEDRFWNRVDKRTEDECWEWLGGKLKAGYGSIKLGGRSTKQVTTHRLSWEIHNGPIPEGMLVCHHCDNPSCVNPKHLYLGTATENARDAALRSRLCVGEDRPNSKLTEANVREIRTLAAEGHPQSVLAEKFGVGRIQISRIVNRHQWKHVA